MKDPELKKLFAAHNIDLARRIGHNDRPVINFHLARLIHFYGHFSALKDSFYVSLPISASAMHKENTKLPAKPYKTKFK